MTIIGMSGPHVEDRRGRELGEDGWYEAARRRDIWYLNLVHFTGPIVEPVRLVEWVADRRSLAVGHLVVERDAIVRWAGTGNKLLPVAMAEVALP